MYQIMRVIESLERWETSLRVQGGNPGTTVTRISKAIHMKPSTHLRRLLDACVTAGWLERERGLYRPKIDRYAYYITPLGEELVREIRSQEVPF
jgi:DNA-binding MarR family transcriptional regulator